MVQSILKPTVIAMEGLMQLSNNMVMGANVHRQYKKEFVKIGETVTIRRPVKFVATSGATRSNQDVMVPPLRCGCRACNPDAIRMFLCETCGNKRCPHATDHRLTCTGSNDPGQPGSVY